MSFKQKMNFNIMYEDEAYVVVCVATVVEDHNYGADADGRRGIYASWVDDVDVKSITTAIGVVLKDENISDDMRDFICEEASQQEIIPPEGDY